MLVASLLPHYLMVLISILVSCSPIMILVDHALPHESSLQLLASFPGLPQLQFLMACSMQKRSQKAW